VWPIVRLYVFDFFVLSPNKIALVGVGSRDHMEQIKSGALRFFRHHFTIHMMYGVTQDGCEPARYFINGQMSILFPARLRNGAALPVPSSLVLV